MDNELNPSAEGMQQDVELDPTTIQGDDDLDIQNQEDAPSDEDNKQDDTDWKAIAEQKDKDLEEYKTKYNESSKEAQILIQRNKDLQGRADQSLTDTELQNSYPDIDISTLSTVEKTMLRKTAIAEIASRKAVNEIEDFKQEKINRENLDKFIRGNPYLQGKTDDFRKYVSQPTHRNVSLEILEKAFRTDVNIPKKKIITLEGGSNGGGQPAKIENDGSDLETLRKTNPKAYRDAVRAMK